MLGCHQFFLSEGIYCYPFLDVTEMRQSIEWSKHWLKLLHLVDSYFDEEFLDLAYLRLFGDESYLLFD